MPSKINVFWFKRDLRLFDNEVLYAAINQQKPLLLVYFFEPSLLGDPHYSERHWRFVLESIQDLNSSLEHFNTLIITITKEVIPAFLKMLELADIDTVFSTEETGINRTFDRDKAFKRFCKENEIKWLEHQNGGVVRGLKNRENWRSLWDVYMVDRIKPINLSKAMFQEPHFIEELFQNYSNPPHYNSHPQIQKGGRRAGKIWEESFFNERLAFYSSYISKPENSRYGCSRLSPYFAWGCLSIREVYQRAKKLKKRINTSIN